MKKDVSIETLKWMLWLKFTLIKKFAFWVYLKIITKWKYFLTNWRYFVTKSAWLSYRENLKTCLISKFRYFAFTKMCLFMKQGVFWFKIVRTFFVLLSNYLSLSHTQTHTHPHTLTNNTSTTITPTPAHTIHPPNKSHTYHNHTHNCLCLSSCRRRRYGSLSLSLERLSKKNLSNGLSDPTRNRTKRYFYDVATSFFKSVDRRRRRKAFFTLDNFTHNI